MKLMQYVKKAVRKLDQHSPWPLFYSFIMTKDEKSIFSKKIKNSTGLLEFGLGGSTIYALQKSKAKIYTVESSYKWINYVRKFFFIRYYENKRLTIHYIDLGPIGEWGYPESNDHKNLFPNYSSSIFNVIGRNSIDIAIIDGRFRVACVLKIILECHQNNKLEILIHDFWNRKEYHIVLKYLDVIDKVDTLGVFSIKNNVDLKLANMDYMTYKFNPA